MSDFDLVTSGNAEDAVRAREMLDAVELAVFPPFMINGEAMTKAEITYRRREAQWMYGYYRMIDLARQLFPVSKIDSVVIPAGPVPLDKFFERDFCPECGTNLAARAKERKRRREYMKDRRAKKS